MSPDARLVAAELLQVEHGLSGETEHGHIAKAARRLTTILFFILH